MPLMLCYFEQKRYMVRSIIYLLNEVMKRAKKTLVDSAHGKRMTHKIFDLIHNHKGRELYQPCEVPLSFPTAMNSNILSFTSVNP